MSACEQMRHGNGDRGMESTFTEQIFRHICQLINDHTGIVLDDNKRDMVYSRLSRRLRKLHIDDFAVYCQQIALPGSAEMQECINALTTNLTAFFRENHHFEYLADKAIPEILGTRPTGARIRIWSAGCSTGKEPYSLAIVLREKMREEQLANTRILATDLDTEVLSQASSGIYECDDGTVQGLPETRLQRFFDRGSSGREGYIRAKESLRSLIAFRQLNLMGDWPMRGPFDIVFCRNVVIYFDKDTQRKLFDRFANLIADNGLLFIGHSESLHNVTERFELIGQSIYRKVS